MTRISNGVAHHEAGHAVAAVALGQPFLDAQVFARPTFNESNGKKCLGLLRHDSQTARDAQAGKAQRDEFYMPPEFWGEAATLPPITGDGSVHIAAPGVFKLPPGKRYAVIGFDPDTTERYWAAQPPGAREAARKRV